ncbi:MAG: hypothetical protein AB1482_03640 [Pseudomonadota bacterium]
MNPRRSFPHFALAVLPALFAGGCASLGGEKPARVRFGAGNRRAGAGRRAGRRHRRQDARLRHGLSPVREPARRPARQGRARFGDRRHAEEYLDAMRRDQRYQDWNRWTFDGGWWYGGGPYGWPGPWH